MMRLCLMTQKLVCAYVHRLLPRSLLHGASGRHWRQLTCTLGSGADDWQVSSFSTLPAAPPSSSKEMQPAWAPRAGSTAAMANLQAMYQEAPSRVCLA